MKKIIFIVLSFLVISSILYSCSKSAKTILIEGDEWSFQKPNEATKSCGEKILKFIDNETISFGNEDQCKILWIDDNTFRLSMDGKVTVFKFSDFENDKSKVAILYENEKVPENEEEWLRLQSVDRVLQLINNKNITKSPDFYIINERKIPVKKVPPAGIYVEIEKKMGSMADQNFLLLKVIIENGIVKFQYGDSYDNKNINGVDFNDIQIRNAAENGIFMLKGFDYGLSYQGYGVIEFLDGKILVAEGEPYDNYPLLTKSSNDDSEDLINECINRALEYGFIFNNDDPTGKIVKVELSGNYPHSYGGGVTTLDVPEGKMWTPLYYEQVKGSKDVDFLDVFYKTRSGYTYNDSYRFELKKKDFVSVKLSKQNNTAFTRKDQIAIDITSYSRTKTKYVFYCLEESI